MFGPGRGRGTSSVPQHQPPESPTGPREGRSGQGLGVGAELKGWVGEEVQTTTPHDW